MNDIHFSSFFRDMIDLFFQVPPVPFQRGTPKSMAWLFGCPDAVEQLQRPQRLQRLQAACDIRTETESRPDAMSEPVSWHEAQREPRGSIIWTSTVRYCESLRLNTSRVRQSEGNQWGTIGWHFGTWDSSGDPQPVASRSNKVQKMLDIAGLLDLTQLEPIDAQSVAQSR